MAQPVSSHAKPSSYTCAAVRVVKSLLGRPVDLAAYPRPYPIWPDGIAFGNDPTTSWRDVVEVITQVAVHLKKAEEGGKTFKPLQARDLRIFRFAKGKLKVKWLKPSQGKGKERAASEDRRASRHALGTCLQQIASGNKSRDDSFIRKLVGELQSQSPPSLDHVIEDLNRQIHWYEVGKEAGSFNFVIKRKSPAGTDGQGVSPPTGPLNAEDLLRLLLQQ